MHDVRSTPPVFTSPQLKDEQIYQTTQKLVYIYRDCVQKMIPHSEDNVPQLTDKSQPTKSVLHLEVQTDDTICSASTRGFEDIMFIIFV